MKYYISSLNGSGIETNSFDKFMAYLKDMAEIAEKQNEPWFEINVVTYLTDKKVKYIKFTNN